MYLISPANSGGEAILDAGYPSKRQVDMVTMLLVAELPLTWPPSLYHGTRGFSMNVFVTSGARWSSSLDNLLYNVPKSLR